MICVRSILRCILVALFAIAFGLVWRTTCQAESPSAGRSVEIHVYSQPGCPFCQRAKAFLERARNSRPWLQVIDHDIQSDDVAMREFEALVRHEGIERPGVPLIALGDSLFLGFDLPETTGAEIMDVAESCRQTPCGDLRGDALGPSAGDELAGSSEKPSKRARIPEVIDLPLFGPIETRTLSLPLLTIALAAADGFNPCAMWVLIFLIGLMLGMKNRARMWVLGGAFLFTSAIVYFSFLAAWLNVFLFLGTLFWIRMLVGGFALAAGLLYLHEFAQHSEAYCRVTNVNRRHRIMNAAKRIVEEEHFVFALGGIIILAVAVNLIELLCSAGLPAVFTNVLSLSDLSFGQYYAYLALYLLVFLADDIAIFVAAMVSLRVAGTAAAYSRYAHLLGGGVMTLLGVLLILRPEWLAFV